MGKLSKEYRQLSFVIMLGLVIFSFQNCGKGITNIELPMVEAQKIPDDPLPPATPTPGPTPFLLKNQWALASSNNAPSGRMAQSTVWTGSKMIVFGGIRYTPSANVTDFQFLNDGGIYDPALAAWTSLGTLGAPSGRHKHSAVWTGNQMIVFGGFSDTTILRDGAIYDPVMNSWSPLNVNGAPTARGAHTAVWTGSKMLIFGGFTPGAATGAGGVYDPALNTWTSMGTLGAPSAREEHSAIWTGSKMIIFGGYNQAQPNQLLNDGASYDPVTNTWAPISMQNAPSGRRLHKAYWTGSKMIILGGTGSGMSGGIYDPATDSWVATSMNGAPDLMEAPNGVWTGNKAVIYGDVNSQRGGGIYDPATNSWQALNVMNAPAGRRFHQAVWTGSKMLVFGGVGFESTNFVFSNAVGVFD